MTITITSKHDGFRRCGMAHPATPTEYPDDTFTEDELKVLQEEPMLVVVKTSGAKGKTTTTTAQATVTKPEGEALTAAIVAVIPKLDKDKDFTNSGTPKIKSVEQALGYGVTADDVSAAFEKYTKDNA